jgi:3',5'-cyclic AMP phosphodiesterase CpdA
MIIAQITDAHMTSPGRLLFGDYDPASALRRTLRALAELRPRPDLVLFTGDLTEGGGPEEYSGVLEALEGFDLPVAAIPGNHDRRAAFAAAFAGTAVRVGTGEFLHFAVEDRPLRLIGLDTLDEGESRGLLCEARLDWIERTLAAQPDRPTVIFMHHPPFATGIGFMDTIACVNGERLGELVLRHGKVLRVLCGHVHRPVHVAFGGTIASICPGIAYEVPLRLAPTAAVELLFQQPAFQLHVQTDFGLVTHTDYLRDA